MIVAENVTMTFRSPHKKTPQYALNQLSCTIPSGSIYGLIGSNGAGKSTFLRLLSGVYRPQSGKIEIDGQPVFENPSVKKDLFFLPDELYFLPQATMKKMASLYRSLYPSFCPDRFRKLSETFNLDPSAPVNTFSKGMKRQAATVLALSCMPKYLFFDETFDGLDPVMRKLVKKVLYEDVLDRGMTTIIASHSLRELEDTCDQLALLHQGGIVFESDIQNLKTALFKIQIAFADPYDQQKFTHIGMEILSYRQSGSVATFIVRGNLEACEARLRLLNPLLLNVLPLNLEEVFIYEMEALGYAFTNDLL